MEDSITIDRGDIQYVCHCTPLKFKEANKLLLSMTNTFAGVISGGPLNINEDDLTRISEKLLSTITVEINDSKLPLNAQIDIVLQGKKRMVNWLKLVNFALYHNLGDIEDFFEEVAGMLGTSQNQES